MVFLKKGTRLEKKLEALSKDSQYDLACACSVNDADHRIRSKDDQWIYPVTFADGRKTFLFKTLLSNVCVNNCRYCPLRSNKDPVRHTLSPDELASTFLNYRRLGLVNGFFLSSGVIGTPDNTMQKINDTASILRKKGFKGYMHLKIIPGSSKNAIEEAVSLASAVSVNIETPGEKNFKKLCTSKKYLEDVVGPIKFVSNLTRKGSRYSRVKQTTQFVVGASNESDKDIISYTWRLYKNLGLNRVYFSAYQRGLGESNLPGEFSEYSNKEILTREHRLYQMDWLIRKYKFKADEIPVGSNGNLSLDIDPKEAWARKHPEFFPVNINRADKYELLRVPGLGHITVDNILKNRKEGRYSKKLSDIGRACKRLKKIQEYIKF